MDLVNRITTKLLTLGVKPNHKGFHYTRDIIQTYLNNPTSPIGHMYEVTADNFDTTASKVERGIRFAKEKAGYIGPNHKFIAELAEQLRVEGVA